MRYLLDTNVYSELRKRTEHIDPAVVAWTRTTRHDEYALSVISLFETARGIARLRRRDPIQAQHIQTWLEKILDEFRGRILKVDIPIALAAARLHVPDPRPELDSLIAATALVHGLTVVTRNTQDFEAMGVPLINPWEY